MESQLELPSSLLKVQDYLEYPSISETINHQPDLQIILIHWGVSDRAALGIQAEVGLLAHPHPHARQVSHGWKPLLIFSDDRTSFGAAVGMAGRSIVHCDRQVKHPEAVASLLGGIVGLVPFYTAAALQSFATRVGVFSSHSLVLFLVLARDRWLYGF